MLFTKLSKLELILGSSSPRRKELLAQLGLKFHIMKPNYIENSQDDQNLPSKRVFLNANGKGLAIKEKLEQENSQQNSLIISADTIVALEYKILEKPVSYDEAFSMLKFLSGRSHKVYTGLFLLWLTEGAAVKWQDYQEVMTEVFFKELSEEEIHVYLAREEYKDKAGSYAIQGFGSYMVSKIIGSHSNVIGLPLCQLYQSLYQLEKKL